MKLNLYPLMLNLSPQKVESFWGLFFLSKAFE